MIKIKREAAIVAVSGIVGGLAGQIINNFSENSCGSAFECYFLRSILFCISFFFLLIVTHYLFKKIDERTIKVSRRKMK